LGFSSLVKPKLPAPNSTQVPVSTTTPSPTLFEPTPTTDKIIVTLFFNNSNFNPNAQDCSAVFPVKRQLPRTNIPVRAVLDQLFLGPTPDEKIFTYNSIFSENTKDLIKSINVKSGEVYLDFNKEPLLEAVKAGANTSCGGSQFISSIEKTLLEVQGITTVNSENFTLNGSRSAYLNLMQQ